MDYAHGLTVEKVKAISKDKNEPKWMLDKRQQSFALYADKPMPSFGPSLSQLDLEKISYYTSSALREATDWQEVPQEIYDVYDKLGIPKAEHDWLGGVGAQFDSSSVYHRIKDSLAQQGVIFENMDTALHKYPELLQKYFMTDCVPAKDHKFTMLHGAVWSGGTFIYVPPGVKVAMPLQAYFRMNAPSSGQFEHTLIIADVGSELHYIEGCSAPKYTTSSLHAGCVEIFVLKDAKVTYSSIENWSKNTFNLNTKKAIVYEGGKIEWLNGNMGSQATMLYPSSILIGDGAQSESLGIVVAGSGQVQDTGSKVVHIGKNTSSITKSKSISKDGGISMYRGYVKVAKSAVGASVYTQCDALILDAQSSSKTHPVIKQANNSSSIAYEAKAGKLNTHDIEYLILRGYDESSAIRLLVGGFMDDVFKKLPLEYALELNRMIDLEIQGM